MADYTRPEHRAVAAALRAMDHDLLLACRCWFGGGTEIVLDLGEYRLSKDIDFRCADTDGYRELRARATLHGTAALFGAAAREERAARCDQYGIRGIVAVQDVALRYEIVRVARIALDGQPDLLLGVPRLGHSDRVAEKLLANADRCQDRSTAFRDAIDLGMLALRRGAFPDPAVHKAQDAYGDDIVHKLAWAMARLSDDDERRKTADTLSMAPAAVDAATLALTDEVRRLRPTFNQPPPLPPAPPG